MNQQLRQYPELALRMVLPVLSPIHAVAGGGDGAEAGSEGRAVLLTLSHTVSQQGTKPLGEVFG